jgi:hypothetical protein
MDGSIASFSVSNRIISQVEGDSIVMQLGGSRRAKQAGEGIRVFEVIALDSRL